MPNTYELLEEQFQKLARLDHAITFLQWDQLVMMPPGGNDSRSNAIAELSAMYHEILTAPQLGDLLDECQNSNNRSDVQRSLLEMTRVRQQALCLPAELVKAKSLAGSKCEHGWRTQRKENDWSSFLLNFEEVVNLSREEAKARQAAEPDRLATPYDALLDLHCTGDSSKLIQQVFSELKTKLPELLQQIYQQQDTSEITFDGPFGVNEQKKLNLKLMEHLGFNFEEGRLDISMHPFSTGDRGDHRITTRFRQTDFLDALQATAHETGHASYESGLPLRSSGLPVGSSRNMCIHESQSLLFEKQLFLSKPFLSFFIETIHDCLPQTKNLSSEQIWSACCSVQSSYIRVEADEVTYPLHIILRFEIESELINGNLEAADIPDTWDEKMRKYLGLSTSGNYTDGCLQDIHWTDGSFGYFPSYTLGAINSTQLFASIKKVNTDWEDRLARGDVSFIRSWLKENIWQKASSMDSQDIIREATGEGTNPEFFLTHLHQRYVNKE